MHVKGAKKNIIANTVHPSIHSKAFHLTGINGDRQNETKSNQTQFIYQCVSSKETLNLIGRESDQSKSSSQIKTIRLHNISIWLISISF